ncbi:hypothetical protein [Salana multivorans]
MVSGGVVLIADLVVVVAIDLDEQPRSVVEQIPEVWPGHEHLAVVHLDLNVGRLEIDLPEVVPSPGLGRRCATPVNEVPDQLQASAAAAPTGGPLNVRELIDRDDPAVKGAVEQAESGARAHFTDRLRERNDGRHHPHAVHHDRNDALLEPSAHQADAAVAASGARETDLGGSSDRHAPDTQDRQRSQPDSDRAGAVREKRENRIPLLRHAMAERVGIVSDVDDPAGSSPPQPGTDSGRHRAGRDTVTTKLRLRQESELISGDGAERSSEKGIVDQVDVLVMLEQLLATRTVLDGFWRKVGLGHALQSTRNGRAVERACAQTCGTPLSVRLWTAGVADAGTEPAARRYRTSRSARGGVGQRPVRDQASSDSSASSSQGADSS